MTRVQRIRLVEAKLRQWFGDADADTLHTWHSLAIEIVDALYA